MQGNVHSVRMTRVAILLLVLLSACSTPEPPAPVSTSPGTYGALTTATNATPTAGSPPATPSRPPAPTPTDRAGKRWVRLSCSYTVTSLIGKTTQDGILHGGPNWNPNGVPGPTYRDLAAAFAGQPLTPTSGYTVVNDVQARFMSVLIYTDATAMTADAVGAAKDVMIDSCGSPVVVEPGP